ncbi:hypothetical protein RHGRI_001469 [Rhododendron griersonianum]|uniref:Uncharacterized protein n=1 Tax=Rhododendron griersonianum TaxID=479676 RepID=A0AAV6LKT8_9ERIC|nr:hypothetical protein RHGRI_001469 [Rhododendron griersonianum]
MMQGPNVSDSSRRPWYVTRIPTLPEEERLPRAQQVKIESGLFTANLSLNYALCCADCKKQRMDVEC